MEHGQKLCAAKTASWPGATPFSPPVCGPNPLRGFGGHSRPGCTRSTRAFGVLPRTRIQSPDSNLTRASRHHSRPLQTRAAPQLFRQGDQRYQENLFDQMYQDWANKGFSPTEVKALVNASPEQPRMAFKTHLLPESYDILDHVSVRKNRHRSGTLRGNALSTNDSARSSTSGSRKYLQAQEQTLNNTCNTDAGKNLLWPGATPIFGASITPKSLRASGVATGHSVGALHTNFPPILRPQCRRFLPEQITGVHMHDPESNRGEQPMPRLKPTEPVIAERRYFARIEEPLALTMEHDTEALGTDNLDSVVSRALQFMFKRDSQFKSWLGQKPDAKRCDRRGHRVEMRNDRPTSVSNEIGHGQRGVAYSHDTHDETVEREYRF
jgi:hypothetical protein